MQLKKVACLALTGAVILSCFGGPAWAAEADQISTAVIEMQRATNRFEVTISGNTLMEADSSFDLSTNESVTINATYLPKTASVDFGLIDSDNVFHYVNITGGSINKSIQVDERGEYTLAIRNNSSRAIDVSGFVKY